MSVTGNSSALEGEILSSFNILFRTIDSNTVREYNPQKVNEICKCVMWK